YTSRAVMEALGSVLTNKYSEGYPKKRYYQGNKIVDEVESLAQDRAKKLFSVPYVNVQALSGSPANAAVYFALLDYKDKIMGLSLAFGGHLTHGAAHTFSSRFFTPVQYMLGKNGLLDYDEIEKLALKEKPKIIVCGFTAYTRIIDFKRFSEIAEKVGSYLLADVSHITGLIIAGVHPSPVPYADIVMTTTHKTLRGPRGAMIMVTEKGLKKNPDLGKKIDSAIIPGLQGGPHDNQTAAIAVALKEAALPSFKTYGRQIVKNAKALAKELLKYDFNLVSGGTDNHLILIDLKNKGVNGKLAAFALEVAGVVTNMNGVPFDTMSPLYPSGIRLGTPAITTRGMKEKEMVKVADFINRAVEEVKNIVLPSVREERIEFMKKFRLDVAKNKKLLQIAREVKSLCSKFPVP
ncbi:MAG: serine hydroxymethyltransferase, partial [Candidatus Levybacteria bacterium RIFCSPHIGHO2_02_FULL_37_13]